ncbi:Hsp70 family protein [Sphingomonas sp. NFR15]|uniref:Hsp70 family protein n=1 Tax=Sphingomonas sp. NFR15 TaxID=1566282 RepID=UPI00088CE24E|nr:molecular chaperone HscC [Sphingomonas sp. NFR15]SDA36523.1 molecular chaperone HscC [Sphingomonas sp. NFR15]
MIIGIDLGTTNSACAVWKDGAATLIPNRLGETLTPSAVSIDDGGAVLVGMAARERQASHPDATVTAFKRYMGTKRTTRLGGRDYSAEELSALVLRSLKEDAETFLGEPVTEAVITVPAYFNDQQRKATHRAGELAGLRVERLINEPTAAALAYGIHNLDAEARFFVFDLGGGTFDVSIVEIFEGIIEVRASTGDNQLGGEDFNEVLIALMRERFAPEWGEAAHNDRLYQRLREQAERARRDLSGGTAATLRVVWQDRAYEMEIDAATFEAQAAGLIERLRAPVLRALRDSDLRPEALSDIILIGGATRMPLVRRAVARMFGRFPNATVNPDEAVALGAAVQAGLKARDAALKEVVVTDVCPYSLGVNVSRALPGGGFEHGIFAPILERNTVIPASRVHGFQTLTDNQAEVVFGIYQGEARLVRDNVEIGKTKVKVPRGPAGQDIEVRFSYDVSGLLEVDIVVAQSGERTSLVINDDHVGDDAKIAERRALLASLKTHPRDEELNRAALARGEKCYENFLGDDRAHVDHLISRFQHALDGQDPRAVEQARAEFHAALDGLEGERFL